MLKTFEMKMKALNATRLSREHQGRSRYDIWKLPNGIELLTIHQNEHVSLLAVDAYTISHALAEHKNQRFTLAGFESVMEFMTMQYVPLQQHGKHLAHAVYLEVKDTLFTSRDDKGNLIPNGPMSAYATVITDDVYEDMVNEGVMDKIEKLPPLDYQKEAVFTWLKERPSFQGRFEGFVEAVNGHIESIEYDKTMEAVIKDMATNLGLDATVTALTPEQLSEELVGMLTNPDIVASGLQVFGADGEPCNPGEPSIRKFVEGNMFADPESDLPS